MNKVFLIGNLTKNVELETTPNGVSVAKFTIAINHKIDDGADFINIVAWRELGENCHKFLSRGKKVAVVGSIQIRSYEIQNGEKRYITEVIASEVEFLTPRENALEKKAEEEKRAPKIEQTSFNGLKPLNDEDGLPF